MTGTERVAEHQLQVPGARLHYEVRGSGPVLVLIPGGAMDATGFGAIAPLLAAEYTVVAYDPRGLGRSTFDGEPEDVTVGDQASDAHRLLRAVGSEPAFVFGSSGGAVTGLELARRYDTQVRALVAHEPPLTTLLDDRDQHIEQAAALRKVYAAEGAGAAVARFLAGSGLGESGGGADENDFAEEFAKMQENFGFFLGHMICSLATYQVDAKALRAAATRVAIAAGAASRGQVAWQCAEAAASALATELVEFPGDHGGFATAPEKFAEQLHQTFTALS